MTFLAPLAGLIGAALAVPALLLLYFLKLRRRPVRVSSTMLWESAVRDLQANAPFRWIRPSLLLFLQLLALACLLAAIARPALDTGEPPPARLILLIDRSASMSAPLDASRAPEPGAPTRLDEAKRRAKELVDRLGRSSSFLPGGDRPEAMVIAFGATAQALTPFTSNTTALDRAIDSIRPTDQPASLDDALRLVEPQVASTDESEGPGARVVLLSDGAFAPPVDPQARRPGVGGAEFRYIAIGGAEPSDEPAAAIPGADNVGIIALSAQRDYQRPALLRVFARLLNAGPLTVEAPVTLRMGTSAVGARVVTLPASAPDAPGEASLTFQFESPGAGVLLLSIDRPDTLASDNRAALVIGALRPPRLLVVRPAPVTAGERLASTSLERALEEIAGQTPRVVDLGGYEALGATPGALAGFDLVIFDRTEPRTLPPTASLSFGAGLPITGLRLAPPDAANPSDRVLSWKRSDPLLRSVGLDGVALADAPTIEPQPDDPGAGRAVPVEPIASGATGALIARAMQGGRHRVVVAFPLAQSTWPLQPGFIIFLANAVESLTTVGEAALGRAFTTGAPVVIRPAPGAAALTLSGPQSLTVPLDDAMGPVPVGPLESVGVYTVEGSVPEDRVLAVDLLNATESRLAVSPVVEVGGRRAAATRIEDAAPREVWHWLIALAFALLALEWLLYAWRTRA